ncbi:uncharacterized protein LOC116172867 [Photinus pyralis]|uniref:uncharacterized protein LOC116172867 n=1 Tax=Photinus pyralis TaxID=7054 RepID=UPI00126746F4|nr:uncharacterized protein LOC116172867 [Photinus pyralis]
MRFLHKACECENKTHFLNEMHFFIIFVNLIAYSACVLENIAIHHWEKGRGNFVKGSYSLLDSDGRVRTVDYEVEGDRGFRAVVSYRPPGGSYRFLLNPSSPFRRQNPIWLRQPVGLISQEILSGRKSYPEFKI